MNLIEKLKKNTTIKQSEILTDSKFFNEQDVIQTSVPAVNVALSGKLDGGLTTGLTVFAGPSKHFKTAFAMLLIKAHQENIQKVLFYFMIVSLVHLSLILRHLILILAR